MSKLTTAPEGYVHLGKLGKTKGLKGALRVYPLAAAEAVALLTVTEVFVTGFGQLSVQEVSRAGAHLVLSFKEIRRLEQAKQLVNQDLFAAIDELPKDQDVLYLDELIDLPVWQGAEHLGEVTEVIEAGAQVLLRVNNHLLPLGAPYVVINEDSIELRDPPEGLLEL
jgi:16S rRNA processing protein RimM